VQKDSAEGQCRRTVQKDSAEGQCRRTVQKDSAEGQCRKTVQKDSAEGQCLCARVRSFDQRTRFFRSHVDVSSYNISAEHV
jgi:hypothetical protein